MSPDEISSLFAHDFEKYVITSKDAHIFPYYVSSFSQVTSPMFDVEKDIEYELSLSRFGGVYDNTSNICAHDDLMDVGDVSKNKFGTIVDSSHVGIAAISFDFLGDEEETNGNCHSDYGFLYVLINLVMISLRFTLTSC